VLKAKRSSAVLAAAWLAAAVAPAGAQWRWDPREGWTTPTPPENVKEAGPPRFLPRYREQPEDAPVGTPAGAYYAAYLTYEADEFGTAARMFRRLAEAYQGDPVWASRALFMRGECLFQDGSYYEAYEAFDEMLTKCPGGLNYRLALQREFEIAQRFLRGRRRRVWGIPLYSGSKTGLKILERIREQDPRGPLADDCLAAQGDVHFRKDNFEDAELYYGLLLREHPQSPFAGQALFRIACGQLFRQKGPDYDAGLLREARAGFEGFLRRHPEAPEAGQAALYLRRVEARLAEAYLGRGRFYEKRGRPVAALVYYRRILRELPSAPAAAEAERRIRDISPPEPPAPPAEAPEAPPEVPAQGPEETENDQ